MTRKEFDDTAENWYQRVHKLNAIRLNESETNLRRAKASKLWVEMAKRMMLITEILLKANTPKAPKFKPGGIVCEGTEVKPGHEYIIETIKKLNND